MDGVDTLKLLLAAGKRLEGLDGGPVVDPRALRESSRIVSQAGEAVARFRRLGEVQELMLEVTALVEAGIDPLEVRGKLARATKMANELAIELGLLASDSPPVTPRARLDRPTIVTRAPNETSESID